MIKYIKKKIKRATAFLLPKIAKKIIQFLIWTCRWEVKGLENFCQTAQKEKCIVVFWHNRLALVPFILSKIAPQFIYTAFVSNSRDGDLLASVIHSFACGNTIRVPHHSRHEALRALIKHLETVNDVVIITPDGPRGPPYVVKPGAALAAIETGAHVIPFNWEASSYWSLNTWDALRIPKPFSKITISFTKAQDYKESANVEHVIEKITGQMQDHCGEFANLTSNQ